MPYDIFISYSRRDSPEALGLAERIRAEGLTVWIDQHELVGAEHWGAEIVENIRDCATFIVLLSPNSVESDNVLRELMVAVDRHKRILPIVLEPTDLPSAFDYALAGIQRTPIDDLAAILRAHRHGTTKILAKVDRQSLMVLPFADLSPGNDNGWFADGLTGELISALSNIKSLRVIDRMTSMSFRNFEGRSATLAQELDIRYFLEGSVRKAGEQIKISVELLDMSTGSCLWQYAERGTMQDVFEIQETVAQKVIEGLELHLTKNETERLRMQPTESAEAYELSMKADEYFLTHTRESLKLAMDMYREALELDPYYANALHSLAFVMADYYRVYDRDPALLTEAEQLARRAIELRPREVLAYRALCMVQRLQGRIVEAEATALRLVRKAPESYVSHFALGLHYASTSQPLRAVEHYLEALRLKPDDLDTHWNLIIVYERTGNTSEVAAASSAAVPLFSKWLRLHPHEETRRVQLATLLFQSGDRERGLETLKPLETATHLDPVSLYNIACLFIKLGDREEGLRYLTRSVEAGMRNMEILRIDPDLDVLRERAEFKALVERVESSTVNV